MILPNDILLRETSDGTTVWVSQRMVVECCGVNEKHLRDTYRVRYKQSLPASWQKVAETGDFFLGKTGKSWRWGRKDGQFYYDIDTIPNRAPVCYRESLPTKDDLIVQVDENRLRGSRERRAEQMRDIREQVALFINNSDIAYFEEYAVGDKRVLTPAKARQMAESVAWCRFIKYHLNPFKVDVLGFSTQADFLNACAEILSDKRLEGLKLTTAASLRNKIAQAPDDVALLRDYLVSGKYCNDNRRIIGKFEMVDYTTGEIIRMDEHEAAIMTLWLNPGGSTKDSKQTLYDAYSSIMESIGKAPVKLSTFSHYIKSFTNMMLSTKERHGSKVYNDQYRPYVPAKPLEYANSLWAADGSGVVPYRYRDQYGEWRMMKLYVMFISDTASRYIAGYSYSNKGAHLENSTMLRNAMKMALLDNGKTEVLDFISDNHKAFTGKESTVYLQKAVRNYRTIRIGNSKANPAEMMFRLFKRKFKSYFNLPETSWDARSLESMVNPDYYDIMSLPTMDEAVVKLATAVAEWNSTPLSNGITPEEWFRTIKNTNAGQYSDRTYRLITGNVSKRDLTHSRGIMTLEKNVEKYQFDIPTDSDTANLITKYMGYSSKFATLIYWDNAGADVYTESGVYMFTCNPAPLAAKSKTEATSETLAALGHHTAKAERFDAIVDNFVADVKYATSVMCRNYELNIRDNDTKEEYNAVQEAVSAAKLNKERARLEAKQERAARRAQEAADRTLAEAHSNFWRNKTTDLSSYKI